MLLPAPLRPRPPQSAPDMARMPVLEYAGVEFYGGGAVIPAQYNSITNNDCGVLLLWTRDR